MSEIPTAEEVLSKKFSELKSSFALNNVKDCMIEFAKLHVEAMMKDIEQKLLEAIEDEEYIEENVCDVIEEIRNYKPKNIQ